MSSKSFQNASKLNGIVSVLQFGAIGDGVTDDTAAIQAAINSVLATGGQVLLPAGNYKTTAELLVSASNVSLVGDGGTPKILRYGNGNTLRFYSGSSTVLRFSGVSNICFEGVSTSSAGVHVVFKNCYSIFVENITTDNGWSGFEFNSVTNARIENISVNFGNAIVGSTNRFGVRFLNDGPNNSGDNFVTGANIWLGGIVAGTLIANADYGFVVEGVDGLWISDTHVASSSSANFYFGNTTGKQVNNIYISNTMSDHCALHGIWLNGTTTIDTLQFNGKVSSLGIGLASGNGVLVQAPCVNVILSGSFEGSRNNQIAIDNKNADGIVISDFVIVSRTLNPLPSPAQNGILINSAKNVTICNGVIDGLSQQAHGIRLAGVDDTSFVEISNVVVCNTSEGLSLEYTTGNLIFVTLTGCDFRNNTNAYTVYGTSDLLSAENCLGMSPVIKTFNWTPGTIAPGGQAFTAVSINGVNSKDFVQIGYGSVRTGTVISAYVENTDQVVVTVNNTGGAPITLGATAFKIKVEKFFGTT